MCPKLPNVNKLTILYGICISGKVDNVNRNGSPADWNP